MRLVDRSITAALILILISASGFCIDLSSKPAHIIDYPGGTVSLARGDFGRPLHEEAKYEFLLDLLSFLENMNDAGSTAFAIEITGTLPSSSHGEIIDFYLIDGTNGTHGVLYRYASSANYKRAAITIKRKGIPQEASPAEEGSSVSEMPPDYRVSKGQTVNVVLISGGVTLEVKGEAMESGSGADRIKVRVRDTGREFVGSIAGPMEVHIGL